MKNLIISFISLDRPGLVDTISNVVRQHNGNWQSSSLNHMSGYFTGAIEVAVEASKSQALINALNEIEGLESNIKVSDNGLNLAQPSIVLELTANDREGIIQEVSSIIHKQGGNLIKVVSDTETAPHSGQELFKAKVTVSVASEQIDNLTDAIESLADDLMVDVTR
ncbi:glycine cleavage system protein R [Pseudocolwellia sp. HL-MZ19]|uniref:glycine cleavage system protein R n=1 Tax=unclassified Pseudocolwellia TaxID=2848178 RepID=UPI003CEC0694